MEDIPTVSADMMIRQLKPWASFMAARFNGRVLLTGSALRSATPRDIDIRIIISNDDYEARYGQSWTDWSDTVSQAYVDDIGSLASKLVRRCRANIDLIVMPQGWERSFDFSGAIVLAEVRPSSRQAADTKAADDEAMKDQLRWRDVESEPPLHEWVDFVAEPREDPALLDEGKRRIEVGIWHPEDERWFMPIGEYRRGRYWRPRPTVPQLP